MNNKNQKAMIEAVLFAMAEPVTAEYIAQVLELDKNNTEEILQTLRNDYKKEEHGIQLLRLEGAWQFATKVEFGKEVQKVLDTTRNAPLSSAALEVLAIIAYNQPVSRSFIEQVRGVDSNSTIGTLVQKGLVQEAGRMDLPGKPIAYQTSDAFLRCFGISSLADLPPLRDEEAEQGQVTIYESLHLKKQELESQMEDIVKSEKLAQEVLE